MRKFGGLIAVTDEIVEYEKARSGFTGPVAFIPNSIPHISESKLESLASSKTHMIMVANFRPWHGLDIIMEGIKKHADYSDQYELHLVGDIPETQKTALAAFKNVKLYGHLNYQEIDALYEKMEIGIGGYNLEHKNMKQATALKVREYFANGLKVTLGYLDPAFLRFSFYLPIF